MLKRPVLCAGALVLLACFAPKVDTSTDASMKQSIERVRASLPEGKRADFDKAVTEVAYADLSVETIVTQRFSLSPQNAAVQAMIKKSLNGKTGKQILTEAAKFREEGDQDIREVTEMQKKWEAKEKLASFKVTSSRMYRQTTGPDIGKLIIDLSVTNGTPFPVSRVYFHGTLTNPFQRPVVNTSEDFDYSVPDALAPGQSAIWRFSPGLFSAWRRDPLPIAEPFTVEVVKLDGPDGKTINESGVLDEKTEKMRYIEVLRRIQTRAFLREMSDATDKNRARPH